MKVKDLPKVIKKRAKEYIKQEWQCGYKPKTIMNAFDWSDTTEGLDYWILVYEGKFLDAENHLREKNGDDLKEELFEVEKERKKKRMIELIEDEHWNMEGSNDKEFKGSAFFLDEALDVKVNEPEFVPYKDEMLLKDGYALKKIDLGWNTFIPTSNVHTEASKLGSSAVSIINDSFKKAIEIKRDRIVESVIEKFRSRSEVGIKKYGTTLDRDDLSLEQWLDHAIEEQMDSILYLTKIKEELKKK
jgi:hypothetical protein